MANSEAIGALNYANPSLDVSQGTLPEYIYNPIRTARPDSAARELFSWNTLFSKNHEGLNGIANYSLPNPEGIGDIKPDILEDGSYAQKGRKFFAVG